MPAAPTPGPGLETTFTTPKDEVITVRPMRATDGDGLLEFFHRIPVEDRLYLREDVTDARVVQGWIEKLDYRRVLPLIALAGTGEFLVIDRAGPGSNCDEFQFGDAALELQLP